SWRSRLDPRNSTKGAPMSTMTDIRIEEVRYEDMPDDAFAPLNDLQNAKLAEEHPDDLPRPLAHTIAEIRSIPSLIVVRDFWVWSNDGALIANAYGYWPTTEENRHLVRAELYVRNDHRRRGIGMALLGRLADVAEDEGRTTLMAVTSDRMPSGEPFARRVGAEPKLATHNNRLTLADVDRGLLSRWVSEGPGRAPGYSLNWVERPFGDEVIEEMVDLMGVMNTAPRDDLDMEDERHTAEEIRQRDEALAAERYEMWYLVARHDATGELVGYTEVSWTPFRPDVVYQGDTGVRPEHRGRALGKWLKAAMAQRIIAERPDARCISTGNADSNDAMLGINQAMGFKPHLAAMWWNLDVAIRHVNA
ncbi:MAG: GNAT family N-acetyltransferase, partial [Actinomycetota bacterium]